jgi:hypothetical protein
MKDIQLIFTISGLSLILSPSHTVLSVFKNSVARTLCSFLSSKATSHKWEHLNSEKELEPWGIDYLAVGRDRDQFFAQMSVFGRDRVRFRDCKK